MSAGVNDDLQVPPTQILMSQLGMLSGHGTPGVHPVLGSRPAKPASSAKAEASVVQ
jgi:hypothetical protein